MDRGIVKPPNAARIYLSIDDSKVPRNHLWLASNQPLHPLAVFGRKHDSLNFCRTGAVLKPKLPAPKTPIHLTLVNSVSNALNSYVLPRFEVWCLSRNIVECVALIACLHFGLKFTTPIGQVFISKCYFEEHLFALLANTLKSAIATNEPARITSDSDEQATSRPAGRNNQADCSKFRVKKSNVGVDRSPGREQFFCFGDNLLLAWCARK